MNFFNHFIFRANDLFDTRVSEAFVKNDYSSSYTLLLAQRNEKTGVQELKFLL